MAVPSYIQNDLHVTGALTCGSFSVPAGTLTNAGVNASAAIATTKMVHRYMKTYAQESATAATDEKRVVHTVYGATGTILAFECGAVVACVGAATLDFDCLVNGASILTAVVRVDSGDAAYAILAGTIDTAALEDGDVIEIHIDQTTGGGTDGKGAFATVIFDEVAA
jgi:hypothetical protein